LLLLFFAVVVVVWGWANDISVLVVRRLEKYQPTPYPAQPIAYFTKLLGREPSSIY
jgi:hypothetical protein